ncbi:hypothetical protein [Aeromonas cavernicola]|uniref:Uncharacterized protein n=1 Tax=Aeromonas cavernicola TaxID=1006623 RepID=A0A2H9U1F7_9GAMM|nr:hypothetical protein [Aeromonas cavernicola]PJG57843.1 hypothetical protein CUC53_15800 [Aeromonas cavernicola]
MRFTVVYNNTNDRYSMGVDTISGRFYISIPVSNSFVDYEEYYDLEQWEFDLFKKNESEALLFVKKCRNRELDQRLLIKPGSNRGSAV